MVDYCSVGNRHTLCFVGFHSIHRVPPSYQGATIMHYLVILLTDFMVPQADLHMSQVQSVLPVTVYVLGFGFG